MASNQRLSETRRAANGNNSVEEVPISDPNVSLNEITVDSDLNSGQACVGNLPGVNEGSKCTCKAEKSREQYCYDL